MAFEKNYLWHRSSIENPSVKSYDEQTLKQTLDTEVAYRAKTSGNSQQFFVLNFEKALSSAAIVDGLLDSKHHPDTIAAYEQGVNNQLGAWLRSYIADHQSSAVNIVTQDSFSDNSPLVAMAIDYDAQPVTRNNVVKNKRIASEANLSQLKKRYAHSS